MTRRNSKHNLPEEHELRSYLDEVGADTDMREVARYFGVKSKDRSALRGMVRRYQGRNRAQDNKNKSRDGLPKISVLDVEKLDDDGELIASLPRHEGGFRVLTQGAGKAPVPGDRILARIDEAARTADIIRVLPGRLKIVVGVVRDAGRQRVIEPLDRSSRTQFEIFGHQDVAFADGDLVKAIPTDDRSYGPPRVKVTANLGAFGAPRAIGQAMAHRLQIPTEFPDGVEALAEKARPVELGKRTDFRAFPLVTIDGEDARDFDDAVFAEPVGSGHRIIVAIADVAHYVRPGDAIDREARKRGNSVYFPDHAIPMLPEALSNELCSLKPNVERACLAVDMIVDADGVLTKAHFSRGLMRSAARLTYEQMQDAIDGKADDVTGPIRDPILINLHNAFQCLIDARDRRGTLDLDLPERQIQFDDQGRPAGIAKKERLDSHRVIEEMMILANVAAARALGKKDWPFLYRAHDRPDAVKLEALHDYLERLGTPFRKSAGRPSDFTALLTRIDDPGVREIASNLILRCQAQAVYQPENIGHFGLNLRDYAHFTSPIRRYSDLLLHRALISAFNLGDGGLPRSTSLDDMAVLGEELSAAERRAMEAERRTRERMIALVMETKVGARFSGRIAGAQRFGLFVTLDESGAEGFVPVSMLGDDRFFYEEKVQALMGERYRQVYAVGDRLEIELFEVQPATGSLILKIIDHTPGPAGKIAAKAGLKRKGKGYRHGRSNNNSRSGRRR